ncbi:tetratricopeptide repeat protein [Streptomyces rubiginosohelvolus]|uniref:tetratricopeptide repeat protein n=1 Tax=Streptomyces rubiginosohelvolus TaxID=67362 RepID=UPI00381E9EBB
MNVSGERPIGAESIQVAVSGDNTRVVVLPRDAVESALEVKAPAQAGYLPRSTSGVFVGREAELSVLRDSLTGGGSAAVVQPQRTPAQTISGLGGVGKSALALHYATRYRSHYTLVWWITADSPESILTSLAGITQRLCPQSAQKLEPDQQAAWAITWLQAHPDWLLIFDNVEDPGHLGPYLGTLAGGHHLATSRRATGWQALAPMVSLGLLPSDEATDLLCTIAFQGAAVNREQREAAKRLAHALGHLPLALEQAGAYAHRTGIDLDIYRAHLAFVLNENRDAPTPEQTIARIWDHTLNTITDRDPLAVTLLQAMAWLAPDNIPRTLLECLAPHTIALSNALGELHAYNMIGFTTDRQSVTVHRLVQTVLRTRTSARPHNDGTNPTAPGRADAERAVRNALPSAYQGLHPDDTAAWEGLLPHILALAETTPTDDAPSADTANTYYQGAQYLYHQGRDAHTIALRTAALAQCEQVLGDTHPNTLTSRNNLAGAYQDAGDLEQAIPLYEATLAQCEQVLGDTHPNTLTSRNNLAGAYQVAGDLERAIPLLEATLAQREQVLGDTHPNTLTSRNNLAGAYQVAGDMERAIPLLEATLAQCEQVLGDTHPDTLTSRNNLAGAYQMAGDLERANPLLEATLAQCEQVLGDTHPNTLTSRNNLAGAYQDAGDMEQAIPLYEATLAQREQVLGDTHPNTLTSRNNLAGAYRDAGDLERAIPLYEAALAQCEQVLGDTHPDTLISRNNLAGAYQMAGDLERAIPLLEATLAQCEQVLGDTHPNTLISRNNLARARKAAAAVQQPDTATPATDPDHQPLSDTPEQPV